MVRKNNDICWPIDLKAQIDLDIFDPEFIKDVFYQVIPKKWGCQPVSVRRGLESQYKKFKFKRNKLDISIQFCSNFRSREAVKNVKIVKVVKNNFHTGPKEIKRLDKDLAELFWLYYSSNNLNNLVDWAQSISDQSSRMISEKKAFFITATTLKNNLKENPCPINFNSIEVARILFIFAALLKNKKDRWDLLEAAVLLGNEYIQIPDIQVNTENINNDEEEGCKDQGNSNIVLKKYKLKSYVENKAIQDLRLNLKRVETDHSKILSTNDILAISDKEKEKEFKKINTLRDKNKQLIIDCNKVKKDLDKKIKEVIYFLPSLDTNIIKTRFETTKDLLDYCSICDLIIQNYDTLENKYVTYRDLTGIQKISSVNDLKKIIEEASITHQKSEDFYKHIKINLNKKMIDKNSALVRHIDSWNGDQIFYILTKLNSRSYTPAFSYLIAQMLERSNGIFPSTVVNFLLEDNIHTRDRFRYIDTKIISYKETPEIKAKILAELIIDSVLFDQNHQMLDFYDSMGGAKVFGDNISKIVKWISSNRHLWTSGHNLIREYLNEPIEKSKSNLLKLFVHQKKVNSFYNRVESNIFEKYLNIIFENDILMEDNAYKMVHNIRDGSLLQKISNELYIKNSGSNWNKTYYQLLNSILKKFANFLEDFLAPTITENKKISSQPFDQLTDILNDFSPEGSKNELEAMVRRLFRGEFNSYYTKTLQGDQAVHGRICAEDDNIWLSDFFDFSMLHLEEDIFLSDAIAANIEPLFSGKFFDQNEVVESLLKEKQWTHALVFVEMTGKDRGKVLDKISALAKVEIEQCRNEISSLQDIFAESVLFELEEYKSILRAKDWFDFSEVESNVMQIFEFEDEIGIIKETHRDQKPVSNNEIVRLRNLILGAGRMITDGATFDELEYIWTDELRLRANDRKHLTLIEDKLCQLNFLPEKIAERLTKFSSTVLEARYWLEPDIAEEFCNFMDNAPNQIKGWLESYDDLNDEGQKSTIDLIFWFLNFLERKSEILRAIYGSEEKEEVFEEILEACSIIGENKSLSRCLDKLREEFPDFFENLPITTTNEKSKEGSTTGKLVHVTEINVTNNLSISTNLKVIIQSENWEGLTEYCKERDQNTFIKSLEFVALCLQSKEVSGVSIQDISNLTEVIFRNSKIASLISEKNLLIIIYQIFKSIFVRLDTKRESSVQIHTDQNWNLLFSNDKRFLDIDCLVTLEGQEQDVVKNIFENQIGFYLCKNIWDSVTKTKNSNELRANFISFLHHLKLTGLILKLAGKFAPTIQLELKNFLEARETSKTNPDIAVIAQAFADQVVSKSQISSPFKEFVNSLPIIRQEVTPEFEVDVETKLKFQEDSQGVKGLMLPIKINIANFILNGVEAILSEEDDVYFINKTRRRTLSNEMIYSSNEFIETVHLGSSWNTLKTKNENRTFKLRIRGAGLNDGMFHVRDKDCQVIISNKDERKEREITDETILEYYPGVGSNVQQGPSFHGREDELEELHKQLITSQNPTAVLVTGMRRVGKTSLIRTFHSKHRKALKGPVVSIYFSIAEKKAHLLRDNVSSVIFDTLVRPLIKKFSSENKDHNFYLWKILKEKSQSSGKDFSQILRDCYDEQSLADSLKDFSDTILQILGGDFKRVIIIIDEAEAFVAPYLQGGVKAAELDAMFHSFRDVAQDSTSTGILLSGSNHIKSFTNSYSSAFFGHSHNIELAGIKNYEDAQHLIAPNKVRGYVNFDRSAIEYAIELCAGLPLLMWQVGALTTYLVKGGRAQKPDVRRAIELLVSGQKIFFETYNVMVPVEFDIELEPDLEPDFLWMLLYKIARSSSLNNPKASKFMAIDQTLKSIEPSEKFWTKRLSRLIDLNVIVAENKAEVSFAVPIFAHCFRADKNFEKFNVREQRVL